jgi:hypothetical protein
MNLQQLRRLQQLRQQQQPTTSATVSNSANTTMHVVAICISLLEDYENVNKSIGLLSMWLLFNARLPSHYSTTADLSRHTTSFSPLQFLKPYAQICLQV